MFKKMLTLLFAVLFVVPFAVSADDFDDDFGDFEEDGEEAEESEEAGESDEEDEESPAPAKAKKQSESDAAMRDLMGEPEEKSAPKKAKSGEKNTDSEEAAEKAGSSAPALKGLKPVMLVKGSFNVFGQYKRWNGEGTKPSTMNTMFGSVDEGLLGLEYMGKHVIAKGTVNLRTDNAFMKEAVHNPLMEENLHSIQNGAANALYEIYGGVKFFDVFIKAGKMIPEYGLIDTYQELGMGFATPFLTRSLTVVEGFVPETDAGLSLGYNGILKKDHNLFVGLTLGTGSNKSEFWASDKTMGLYGRIGYGFKEYIKAAVAFQYRNDFSDVQKADGTPINKKVDFIGIGVHLKGAVAGFEMPVSFDYNMMNMVSPLTMKKKGTTGMLVSLAPGYAYHFKHDWIDKVSVAVRFDLINGVYISKNANYLDSTNFRSQGMYYRIGATANFFTKELAGIRAMTGFTFLMQPESKVGNGTYNENGRKKDYGFMAFVLQAGAEF